LHGEVVTADPDAIEVGELPARGAVLSPKV
jgi:hypothetical protein